MNKKTLLERLKLLGYPLFETDKDLDVNQTLAEVVRSKDLRLWEGFPLLLANSLEKGGFQYNAVEANLKDSDSKKYFHNLVVMALALYEYLQLKFSWTDKLNRTKFFDKKLFNKFLECFRKNKDLTEKVNNLSSARVVNTFRRYFKQEGPSLEEYAQMKGEFGLEYSLSQVFSKKQKELFMKKLKNEKMTKTEREYYSRSVRKKVLALADTVLHKLATELVKH